MIGLILTEIVLFLVAIVAGFAIGWRLRVLATAAHLKVAQEDLVQLRAALRELSVRRAGSSSL